MEKDREDRFLGVLKKISPGTLLRAAIDTIVEQGKGGLIVIANEDKAKEVVASGFKLNADFTHQRVAELAKMDRAVVVDESLRKIVYANAYLVPDPAIPSEETGTRHLAAEQTAKQLGVATIAISAGKGRVTVYYDRLRYILQDTGTIVSKVNQALRILEQYRNTFDDLLQELTSLEFEGRVLPFHIANIIQSIVQMLETEEEIRRWFVELGDERELMELLLEWLMLNVEDSFDLIIKDFQGNRRKSEAIMADIRALPAEELLSSEKIMSILGYEGGEETMDIVITSRGYRVLSEIPRIPMSIIERLVKKFKTLQGILEADEEELMQIKGIAEVRARVIKLGLARLKRRLALLER